MCYNSRREKQPTDCIYEIVDPLDPAGDCGSAQLVPSWGQELIYISRNGAPWIDSRAEAIWGWSWTCHKLFTMACSLQSHTLRLPAQWVLLDPFRAERREEKILRKAEFKDFASHPKYLERRIDNYTVPTSLASCRFASPRAVTNRHAGCLQA